MVNDSFGSEHGVLVLRVQGKSRVSGLGRTGVEIVTARLMIRRFNLGSIKVGRSVQSLESCDGAPDRQASPW